MKILERKRITQQNKKQKSATKKKKPDPLSWLSLIIFSPGSRTDIMKTDRMGLKEGTTAHWWVHEREGEGEEEKGKVNFWLEMSEPSINSIS